jgi:uncharacterized protein
VHREPGSAPATTAKALAEELRAMADWLDLDEIIVAKKGDLATALRRAIA